MDAKAEITKVLKDVQESAKEFAAFSLAISSKALGRAQAHLKKVETSLKIQADKLQPTAPPAPAATDASAAPPAAPAAPDADAAK
jgi:hypothetical protein